MQAHASEARRTRDRTARRGTASRGQRPGAPKGRLRLSLPPAFEPWWELLSRFQLQYPDIQLQVHTTERRIDLIEDGIDVALRVGAITHEAMVARRVLEYRHLLVASPALIERFGVRSQSTIFIDFHVPHGCWCKCAKPLALAGALC
ncbi:LysR substrate-binding domain-containing protein [Stenotrophomonas rhizophila]